MKKASSSPPKETKKKKLKTTHLGGNGLKSIVASNGKSFERKAEDGKPVEKFFCVGFSKSFKNQKRKGSHEKERVLVKLKYTNA